MAPDFNKATVDILAKRAGYQCSNPGCRKRTIGPNSDPDKVTLIGEAAHIYGARKGSKRYRESMTDIARSMISNGIWLCRNCHKLIDNDSEKYSSKLLFKWRESHEEFVYQELSEPSERLDYEERSTLSDEFKNYPPVISRVLIDKPDGWEYIFAAELLRFLLQPHLDRLQDLRDGLYVKPLHFIEPDEVFNWTSFVMNSAINFISPLEGLMEKLTESFGAPGEEGNLNDIHRYCKLIAEFLKKGVDHEESIYFTKLPDEAEGLLDLFKDLLGSQVQKVSQIPEFLDEVLEFAEQADADPSFEHESPIVFHKKIVFDLPDSWSKRYEKESRRVAKKLGFNDTEGGRNTYGCLYLCLLCVIVLMVFV